MLPCFVDHGEILHKRTCEFWVKKITHRFLMLILLLLVLSACDVLNFEPTLYPTPAQLYQDANDVIRGICFEAAFDSAKQGLTFVLRDTEAQIAFYDLADNSELCRHPVERVPFDFSGGRVLVGLWSTGVGCTAHHDVLDTIRDDSVKTYQLSIRFVAEGDCPYELVRPFWVSIDGASDYTITIDGDE